MATATLATATCCDRCTMPFPLTSFSWDRDHGWLCQTCQKVVVAHWHIRRAHEHLKALGAPCNCEECHQ